VTVTGGGNQPPVAEANGPYSGAPGTPICFSSAGSFDPDGTITSRRWNFGDGSRPVTAANPCHTYVSAGNFTATLTVTDNLGAQGTDTAPVTVGGGGNQPPVAEANGPYNGKKNIAISFSSAGSMDPDGSIVSYSWNFGDGSPPSNQPNPTHTYTSTGNFTATLTVTDNLGAMDSDTATVNVAR
jgi:PKD repeat protein